MNKKIIIGMTKSFLDLKGSRPRSLELDFLRIIYAFSIYPRYIKSAYLLVMNQEIKNTIINNWIEKYECQNERFKILSLDEIIEKAEYEKILTIIQIQVKKNQTGNNPESEDDNAIANNSHLLEKYLKEYIEDKEKSSYVSNDELEKKALFSIKWDVYLELDQDRKFKNLQEKLENHIENQVKNYCLSVNAYIPLISEISEDPETPTWIAIPGMYGGFAIWIKDKNLDPKIYSSNWSRVIDGSGVEYLISKENEDLIRRGFV
jgi:hypothetical protein